MDRFDLVCPMDYRYLPRDGELLGKLGEYDGMDILQRLQRIVPDVVIPRLHLLETGLRDIAAENEDKRVPMRVDGQHTGITTVGHIFTGYAGRLAARTRQIESVPLDLSVEEARRNEQISDLLYFSVSAFSVEANIATDVRHLWRSEIEEYGPKEWAEERVGSSTMPHKINPADYETIVSLWKRYAPDAVSGILSQITEHQGDSTNQHLPYQTFETLCGLSYATKSLETSLRNLKINV